MTRIASPIAAAALAALLAAAPAAAQEEPMTPQEAYYGYRAAVVAYERCNDIRFDQAQANAIEERIAELMDTPLSPSDRLTIIEEARQDMSRLVAAQGCAAGNAPEVASAVETFEAAIGPAIGLPAE
jgi:triphosphoribosyl-dephospho-CoA synthetase